MCLQQIECLKILLCLVSSKHFLFFRLSPDQKKILKKKKNILGQLYLSKSDSDAQIGSSSLELHVIKLCELNVKFNKNLSVG